MSIACFSASSGIVGLEVGELEADNADAQAQRDARSVVAALEPPPAAPRGEEGPVPGHLTIPGGLRRPAVGLYALLITMPTSDDIRQPVIAEYLTTYIHGLRTTAPI